MQVIKYRDDFNYSIVKTLYTNANFQILIKEKQPANGSLFNPRGVVFWLSMYPFLFTDNQTNHCIKVNHSHCAHHKYTRPGGASICSDHNFTSVWSASETTNFHLLFVTNPLLIFETWLNAIVLRDTVYSYLIRD